MDNGNVTSIAGSTAQNPRGVQRVTISVHNETGKLSLEIDARSLDEALSILDRARVNLEARVKFDIGRALQMQAIQDERLRQIAAGVVGGNGRG